jgi:glutathione S-transferase
MYTLYHHAFCPHSRFIRLVIGEYGLDLTLMDERPWDRREEFLKLNPAGTTPVLVSDDMPAIPGAGIIAEYIDDTQQRIAGCCRHPWPSASRCAA